MGVEGRIKAALCGGWSSWNWICLLPISCSVVVIWRIVLTCA